MLYSRLPSAVRSGIVSSHALRQSKAGSDTTKSLFAARNVATLSHHICQGRACRQQHHKHDQEIYRQCRRTHGYHTQPYPGIGRCGTGVFGVSSSDVLSPWVPWIQGSRLGGNRQRQRQQYRHQYQQVRGKRTRATVKLEDLPQGLIDVEPLPIEEDVPAFPTVIFQARRNMQKFENCVLLTRVGGFYEMYFEHAQEYGPLLNLKVALKKTNAGTVPMAGFPFFQLDRFLKVLVQDLSRYVAIAEEFPNDASDKVKSGGLMHDRRVARVITPGTLIDENFMDPYSNNYVMAIHLPDEVQGSSLAPKGEGVETPKSKPDEAETEAIGAAATVAPLGLAWLDLSTGHFVTQSTTLGALSSVLSRVCPREIVLDQDAQSSWSRELLAMLAEDRHLTTYSPGQKAWTTADWAGMLEADIPAHTLASLVADEVAAGSLLLHYVEDRLQGTSMKLQPPVRYESMEVMTIDKNSMRSLEVKQTIRDGAFRGSLLHAIRRTVTKSGARLLNEWLSAPSTSLDVITFRQDLVSRFVQDEDLREGIIFLLRRCHDSQRLVQKFALGRGDPDDLLDLAKTIRATEGIVALLREAKAGEAEEVKDCMAVMTGRISLDKPLVLAGRIRDAIDEEGLVQQHRLEEDAAGEMLELAQQVVTGEGSSEDAAAVLPKSVAAAAAAGSAVTAKSGGKKGRPTSLRDFYSVDNDAWIMKPAASARLYALHEELLNLLQEKSSLTESLQDKLSAPSLTLKWTPGLGHICHVKGKDVRSLSDSDSATRAVKSSRTTRSFHHPEWTDLGRRLDRQRLAVRAEEQRVFHSLREGVVRCLVPLRRNASVLDELDVAAGFARLAAESGWVRPVLNTGTAHAVVWGRHPTVEGGLAEKGRTFTGNDCFVGSPGQGRLWLITGPNMAGKSTFLRQNALITILAQVGCFVPAHHAELGVVDALFSRVGSADDLYRDRSTFMVEMLETARILRCATPRSFVIMDEIGRGTTPEDGTAVAFACVDHLVRVNRCRALFATHFHAVADLAVEAGMHHHGPGRNGRQRGRHQAVAVGANGGDLAGAVEMYCTDVQELGGQQQQQGDGEGAHFVYVHKLQKGINRRSHALKVARLAGLPEAAIKVAGDVLQRQK